MNVLIVFELIPEQTIIYKAVVTNDQVLERLKSLHGFYQGFTDNKDLEDDFDWLQLEFLGSDRCLQVWSTDSNNCELQQGIPCADCELLIHTGQSL